MPAAFLSRSDELSYPNGMPLKRIFTHRLVRVLRVVLPIAVLVFISIPAWNYWVRREAASPDTPRVPELAKNLTVRTEGFTFSRTEGGRTSFSIRARSSVGFKDSTNTLEDVEVTVFGETDQDPVRRIRSRRCDYDERSRHIRFYENVEFELDAKTRGRSEELVYDDQSRVISSAQPVSVEQPGAMTGRANRFEYAIATGILQMKGDVQLQTSDGTRIETGAAVYFEKENFANVSDGVLLTTPGGWVRGSSGRVDLHPETLSPRSIALENSVTAESHSRDGRESWKLNTVRLDAALSPAGLAEKVFARGNVELQKVSSSGDQWLTGGEVDAILDSSGQVQELEARQKARMLLGSNQTLQANRISMNASRDISTEAESILQIGDSVIQGRNFTIQSGDVVTFTTPFRAVLRSGGRSTSADTTEARFDNRTNRLIELVQTGNFQFAEADRSGRAARARLEDGGTVIDLEGSSVILLPEMQLQAGRIRFDQRNNSFAAAGNVRTVTRNSGERVLVSSGRAEGNDSGVTYTDNVQLWRGTTEIKSDRLVVARADNSLHAEGQVRSNLDSFRARSDKLDYDDRQRMAHYTGRVRAQQDDMILETQDMRVNVENNEVSDIAARGGVVLTQGDRRGAGEEAVYNAKTETITLMGKNATVTDPERGVVRGTRLVMSRASDRVLVEGESGSPVESRHPVKR
jgi:LPS export ABC transporter protein LptC/lipopolysaccharide transport protein LptA